MTTSTTWYKANFSFDDGGDAGFTYSQETSDWRTGRLMVIPDDAAYATYMTEVFKAFLSVKSPRATNVQMSASSITETLDQDAPVTTTTRVETAYDVATDGTVTVPTP